MKVIQLANMKALANVSFTAQDASLTLVANGVEADVEKYLERDLDSLTSEQQSAIEYNLTAAAVLKWQDPNKDIWERGILARALFKLRLPGIAVEASS